MVKSLAALRILSRSGMDALNKLKSLRPDKEILTK